MFDIARKKLLVRFFAVIFSTFAAAGLFSTFIAYMFFSSSAREDYREYRTVLLRSIIPPIRDELWYYDPQGLDRLASVFVSNDEVLYAEIRNQYGKVIVRHPEEWKYDGETIAEEFTITTDSGSYLGRVKIIFSADGKTEEWTSALLAFTAVLMTVGSGAVVLTSLWFMRRHIMQPMGQLLEVFAESARSGRSITADWKSDDEFGDLVRNFNIMQRKLGEDQRRKENFLAIMSHELRTPLNAIIGLTELIVLGIASKEKSREYLNDIRRSSRNLLGLINAILDYQKVITDDMKLDMKVCDARNIINDILKLTVNSSSIKQLRCQPRVDGQAFIWADEMAFRQIMLNLLDNATRYADANSVIDVAGYHSGDKYVISITNQASGMPGISAARFFDPFTQGSRDPMRSDEKGVGLGLSIVRELVRRQGGTVHAAVHAPDQFQIRVAFPWATVKAARPGMEAPAVRMPPVTQPEKKRPSRIRHLAGM